MGKTILRTAAELDVAGEITLLLHRLEDREETEFNAGVDRELREDAAALIRELCAAGREVGLEKRVAARRETEKGRRARPVEG